MGIHSSWPCTHSSTVISFLFKCHIITKYSRVHFLSQILSWGFSCKHERQPWPQDLHRMTDSFSMCAPCLCCPALFYVCPSLCCPASQCAPGLMKETETSSFICLQSGWGIRAWHGNPSPHHLAEGQGSGQWCGRGRCRKCPSWERTPPGAHRHHWGDTHGHITWGSGWVLLQKCKDGC